jgi:hypothetical protein
VTRKPPPAKQKTPAKRNAPPGRNPTVLVAGILGAVVVVGLLLLLLVRRSPAPATPRTAAPAARTAPVGTPFAPVYGGGAPSGRPRAGF